MWLHIKHFFHLLLLLRLLFRFDLDAVSPAKCGDSCSILIFYKMNICYRWMTTQYCLIPTNSTITVITYKVGVGVIGRWRAVRVSPWSMPRRWWKSNDTCKRLLLWSETRYHYRLPGKGELFVLYYNFHRLVENDSIVQICHPFPERDIVLTYIQYVDGFHVHLLWARALVCSSWSLHIDYKVLKKGDKWKWVQ